MYDNAEFLCVIGRGRHTEGAGPDDSSSCIFRAPLSDRIIRPQMTGQDGSLCIEFTYGLPNSFGAARIKMVGSNLIIEETDSLRLSKHLTDSKPQNIGSALISAIQFKIRDLSSLTDLCVGEMKNLEDELDDCTDNTGTYRLLDFRRAFADVGRDIISLKEMIAQIDKGYYPQAMQNSYTLQGQVAIELRFLDERYELVKNTIVKDMDTYTSIVNNNINRNTRILSLIALVGVALNFFFASLLQFSWVWGVVGGLIIVALVGVAVFIYHRGGIKKKKTPRRGGVLMKDEAPHVEVLQATSDPAVELHQGDLDEEDRDDEDDQDQEEEQEEEKKE